MLPALGLLLLLAADGRGLSVVPAGTPDEGCPSSRQVTEALAARLPGTGGPPGGAPGPGVLRLSITPDTGGGLRLDLVDHRGTAVLRRQLPAAPRGRPGDCPVLADTIALIVERYWREVGYDVPASAPSAPAAPPPAANKAPPPAPIPAPPSPPPPGPPDEPAAAPPRRTTVVTEKTIAPKAPPPLAPWSVGAALAGRTHGDGLEGTVQLTLGTERRLRALPLGLRLTGGAGTRTTVPTPPGTSDLRRYPLRLGAYLVVKTGFGRIEPGLGLATDLITIARTDPAGRPPRAGALCSDTLCASPGADLSLGWSYLWTPHLYLRALARGGLAAPFAFVNDAGARVWSTPRTYLEVALECGVWFP